MQKFSIETGFFIPSPPLAAEKQGLGLKFSTENGKFQTENEISSENGSSVRRAMVFHAFERE